MQDRAAVCSLMEAASHREHGVLFIRGSEKGKITPFDPRARKSPSTLSGLMK